VNEKALALVKKLGVTPEDNDTSKAQSQACRAWQRRRSAKRKRHSTICAPAGLLGAQC
jgi:hypothetical protein